MGGRYSCDVESRATAGTLPARGQVKAFARHSVNALRRYAPRDLCVPSQYGAFAVCLHWQSQASPDFSAVNFFGAKDEPLCAPLQKGCVADLPQVQNQ